ncbi:hypothetical protein AB0395_16660 [Streptosporangium sp. NPDC051023]|uniref:hypothetical protein n=1 Tax=Streptosporangium sp. NPDC051023 TaxID=3155410 RepID=UPI00344B0479
MTATQRSGSPRRHIAAYAAATGTVTATLLLAALLAGLASTGFDAPATFQGWVHDYGHVPSFLTWILSDTTDAQFYKSTLGGLLMLLGGALAHWAYLRGRRWRGFDICCGLGVWPWMTASALLGVVFGNLVWGWVIPATGTWQPTFVSFVSLSPVVVLMYGTGWPVALTGAALGGLLTTPVALLVFDTVCVPLGLSGMVAATTGMWVSALAGLAICRVLPWIPGRTPGEQVPAGEGPLPGSPAAVSATAVTPGSPSPPPSPGTPEPGVGHGYGPVWTLRRILADFTEAPFNGNELASAGLLAGVLLGHLLDPALSVYGSGLLFHVLAAQLLSAAIGVTLWRGRWIRLGWYPTFIPIVSIAPATVLTYGGTAQSVVAGAVLGALIGPPLGAVLARRVPKYCHPFTGYVMAMTICGVTIVPGLGLIPGFNGG